jgi:hypothetical protein
MPNAAQYPNPVTLLYILIAVAAAPSLALAQSGSAGGSIGNDEKSLSGSREPRAVEPEQPARRSKPAEEEHRAPERHGGDGGGNFNGVWRFVVRGDCPGTSGMVNGVVSGTRFSVPRGGGRVGADGTLNSTATTVTGAKSVASGHLSGNTGSGTFRQSDGCGGSWTASRQ